MGEWKTEHSVPTVVQTSLWPFGTAMGNACEFNYTKHAILRLNCMTFVTARCFASSNLCHFALVLQMCKWIWFQSSCPLNNCALFMHSLTLVPNIHEPGDVQDTRWFIDAVHCLWTQWLHLTYLIVLCTSNQIRCKNRHIYAHFPRGHRVLGHALSSSRSPPSRSSCP